MKPINELPTIITAAGDYVTRSGRRVTIREVADSRPGITAFTAKGSIWSDRRGVLRARGHDIWHVSGRHLVLEESGRDIVGPYRAGERTTE